MKHSKAAKKTNIKKIVTARAVQIAQTEQFNLAYRPAAYKTGTLEVH